MHEPVNETRRALTELELLDRMLDKGVVFDVELHVRVGGIELMTVESQIVVMSLERHRELEPGVLRGGPDPGVAHPQ